MRICLASIHPRMLSGQIDALTGLARQLRELGHVVHIASAFAEADLLDPGRALGATAEPGTLTPRLLRLGRILGEIERVSRDVDVVQLNLPTPGFARVADELQRRIQPPLLVGFEAHLVDPRDVLGGGRWRAAPSFYLPRLLLNNRVLAKLSKFGAARYVVASTLQENELIGLGVSPNRIARIPNLFDPERLGWHADSAVDAIPDNGPIISYIGHFNHVKGVDILVRALPEVAKHHSAVRLVIAWSGLGSAEPIRALIQSSAVADRVHLLGRVSVSGLLTRSDVFVLPYRLTMGQAAYPGLVLEAMAHGVPMVTTNLPLLRELVEPDRLARLAAPEDPLDLAEQILHLLNDTNAGRAMVERQRAVMATQLSPNTLAAEYERVYQEVIGECVPTKGRGERQEARIVPRP